MGVDSLDWMDSTTPRSGMRTLYVFEMSLYCFSYFIQLQNCLECCNSPLTPSPLYSPSLHLSCCCVLYSIHRIELHRVRRMSTVCQDKKNKKSGRRKEVKKKKKKGEAATHETWRKGERRKSKLWVYIGGDAARVNSSAPFSGFNT